MAIELFGLGKAILAGHEPRSFIKKNGGVRIMFPFVINNHVKIALEMMSMRLKLNQENYQLLKELCYEEGEK